MRTWNIETSFSNDKASYLVKLPVLSFKEDNAHIIYCPALDLNGSGNTELQAKESFAFSVTTYLDYTTHKGTLIADLKKLGWTIHKNKTKLASPPLMSELLDNNPEFNRIFENYSYKKFDTGIRLPAYA